MKHKLLITSRSFGQVSERPVEILRNAGFEIDFFNDEFDINKFNELVPEYEALIIGGHKLPASTLERCRNMRIICKHGAGIDNIPIDTAKKMGIKVCNAPGTNADAVADLTLGLIIDICRKISYGADKVKRGEWGKIIGTDVCGKTLGLIGFGAIAKNVARRARGFNMKVLAYDPFIFQIENEFNGYVSLADKDEVLKKSDIVSLHLPLNENTKYIIDKEALDIMKKGAFLINTSRGGVVKESAVAEALKTGGLAGAAFDVTEEEPLRGSNPLTECDNVIITPHMGMYSKEAIYAVSIICARNIANEITGKSLKHRIV